MLCQVFFLPDYYCVLSCLAVGNPSNYNEIALRDPFQIPCSGDTFISTVTFENLVILK